MYITKQSFIHDCVYSITWLRLKFNSTLIFIFALFLLYAYITNFSYYFNFVCVNSITLLTIQRVNLIPMTSIV